jgi:hypothetical protein
VDGPFGFLAPALRRAAVALARLFAGDFLVFVVAAELLAISVFPLVKERLKRRSLFFIAGYAWQISLYVYSLIIMNNQLPRRVDRRIFGIGCARLISGHLRAGYLRSKNLELIMEYFFSRGESCCLNLLIHKLTIIINNL